MKIAVYFLAACLVVLPQAASKSFGLEFFPEGSNFLGAGISLDVGAGYRQDKLKWAFPGFSPGVAIHEKWSNINIGFITGTGMVTLCDHYLFKVDADYGWSGDQKSHRATLIDYNSAEVTRRHSSKTEANVYDVSVGFGRQFCNPCFPVVMTPMIGWSYNHQKFDNPSFYSHKRHESKYAWNSGWLGIDFSYQFLCRYAVYLDYAFHIGTFQAKIDEFFRDHTHTRQFHGNEVGAGLGYQICRGWFSALKFNYKSYWTRNNRSATETADGNKHHRRNGWESYSVSVNLGYDF